jgi:hypothetical protein
VMHSLAYSRHPINDSSCYLIHKSMAGWGVASEALGSSPAPQTNESTNPWAGPAFKAGVFSTTNGAHRGHGITKQGIAAASS